MASLPFSGRVAQAAGPRWRRSGARHQRRSIRSGFGLQCPYPRRGEEILVLDGVFEDEAGRYPAGTYLRNPAGSTHAPGSTDGCTLFVKLRQFQTDDTERVRIDTRQTPWRQGLVAGLSVMPLHQFGHESVALVRWQPQTFFQPHAHFGGEEILVLDGVFEDEFGAYPTGTWMRSPHLSRHQPFSREGCTILVKTGHLPA